MESVVILPWVVAVAADRTADFFLPLLPMRAKMRRENSIKFEYIIAPKTQRLWAMENSGSRADRKGKMKSIKTSKLMMLYG